MVTRDGNQGESFEIPVITNRGNRSRFTANATQRSGRPTVLRLYKKNKFVLRLLRRYKASAIFIASSIPPGNSSLVDT
jgi:hypothetical protein